MVFIHQQLKTGVLFFRVSYSISGIADIPVMIGYNILSFHQFSSTYLRSDCSGSRFSRVSQASFSPAALRSSTRGTPRCSQTRWDYVIPLASSEPTSGHLPSWKGPRTPPRGGVPEASCSDARTTSIDFFGCQGAVALPRAPSWYLSSSPSPLG